MEITPTFKKHLTSILLVVVSIIFISFLVFLNSLQGLNNLRENIGSIIQTIDYNDGAFTVPITLIQQNSKPLYIFTNDGFPLVIDHPINGFLNQADFSKAIDATIPQWFVAPTGERWRVLAKPIISERIVKGVIFAAIKESRTQNSEMVDKSLGEFVNEAISVKVASQGLFEVKIVSQNLDPAVEWVVIDDTNHRVAGLGNPPVYIDRSYIADFPTNKFLTVTDTKTQRKFHLFAKRVIASGYPAALVISASEASSLMIADFTFPYLVFPFTFLVVLIIFSKRPVARSPIIFNKSENRLEQGEKHCVLPHGSLQASLVATLFKKPTKRFEYDELCDSLGSLTSEKSTDRKSVYDAARAVNQKCEKKFGVHLIFIETKSFRLNPLIHSNS